jgi:hypothetical protein
VSDPGEATPGRIPVFQRREARTRQLRKGREPGRAAATATPQAAEGREAVSRGRARQVRTAKQARAAGLAVSDVDAVVMRPKTMVARARRLQSRQLATTKATVQPLQAEGIVAIPKVDLRRVAQGRQVAARKLTARNRRSSE